MKRLDSEHSSGDYLAMLIGEIREDGVERAPRDIRDLVAQLLESTPSGIAEEELAAYYEQSLAPRDRTRVQSALASDPAALADLIALDEVTQAFEAFGQSGSPEEAGRLAAEAASELVPHAPRATGDGVETLLPGKVAKDELQPTLLEPPKSRPFAVVALVAVVALLALLWLLGRS